VVLILLLFGGYIISKIIDGLAPNLPDVAPVTTATQAPVAPLVATTPTWTLTPTSPAPTPTPAGMVYVPAGYFVQGSTEGQINDAYDSCIRSDHYRQCWRQILKDELPQHEVYLDGFYIDKYEVTNAQYAECVEAGFCGPPQPTSSATRSSYFNDPRYADYPVIYVTWHDADRYCRWAGKRLPTEAEWERAARGENGMLWPWGNSFSMERCNVRPGDVVPAPTPSSFSIDTKRVGSYPGGASPGGVMDMVGNVSEWVADWYDESYYARFEGQNPGGPSSGEKKVIRGGSWNCNIGMARAANRGPALPSGWYFDVGFRCAR
jgi:formylglycine-generating enzyme required for sulfatase activity